MRRKLIAVPTIVLVVVVVALGFLPAHEVEADPGLATTDLSTGLTPDDLVEVLLGGGISVSNVTYTGTDWTAGTFSGGTGIIDFEDGVILSTGDIANVIGPNVSDAITRDNGLPGDPDLDTLIPGYTTFDATVLEFDFVPDSDVVSFYYVFGSDEYNEWVDSPYNNVFGFFVNGVNYALIPPVGGDPAAINNINCGNPFVGAGPNCAFYRNNDPNDPGPPTIDTELVGLTVVLGLQAPVTAGATNHMKLAVADAGDRILDGDVFLKTGSVKAEPLGAVGGILELPVDSSDSPASLAGGSGSSAPPYAALVGAAAAAAVAIAAGALYARRRLS